MLWEVFNWHAISSMEDADPYWTSELMRRKVGNSDLTESLCILARLGSCEAKKKKMPFGSCI